ncbi:MAG: hypothetical protein GY821_09755 [Gammaproteobacteria bacterium]|nr:hypothetical protein [Gammaproteobacteria bacterium]
MKKLNLSLVTASLLVSSSFVATASAKPVIVKCPPANQVIITKIATSNPAQYTWTGPTSNVFGPSGTSVPENGSIAKGTATAVVEAYGNWTDYLCIYQSDATTPNIDNIPPNSGFFFYRDAYLKDCHTSGDEFICP